jgi:Hypervirulence associated proteins TUDOR domain
MSKQSFSKGDRVAWDTPQGKTTGRVVEKLTGDQRVRNPGQKGTKVAASEDDPRYVVESDKTGKRAAHRPEALKRRGS